MKKRTETMPTKWIGMPAPNSHGAKYKKSGWLGQMNEAYKCIDSEYAVLVRTITTDQLGSVKHAAIRNKQSTNITWSEKQRIKNELFGEEAQAIEFFPKQSELVDGANMYHLWGLVDHHLDFGLTSDN